MDITALSMSMAQSNVKTSFGIAMLDKTMELNAEIGANFIEMIDRSMELSVNPHIGSNVDIFV